MTSRSCAIVENANWANFQQLAKSQVSRVIDECQTYELTLGGIYRQCVAIHMCISLAIGRMS